MTINEKELEYYRQKIIKKYIKEVQDKLKEEKEYVKKSN